MWTNVLEVDRSSWSQTRSFVKLARCATVRAPARGEGPPWAAPETSAHIESAAIVIISSMSSVE